MSKIKDEMILNPMWKITHEVPEKFKSLLVADTLEMSYVCALNADTRSKLEEEFIEWYQTNVE